MIPIKDKQSCIRYWRTRVYFLIADAKLIFISDYYFPSYDLYLPITQFRRC